MSHGLAGVFVKRGPADRLVREAELLRRARHPGVVELVELRGHAHLELVTRFVDGPSLAEAPPFPVDVVAGLVGALATTVADLHRLGLVHGSILPEHILVEPGGRPVLCALADGSESDDPVECARDVCALGELLRWLLARAPQPQAATRRRAAAAVPALLSLALRATNPDPRLRPSASEVASGVRAAAPHAELPGKAAVRREPEPRRLPRAPIRAAVALVAVSLTLVGVMNVGDASSPKRSGQPATRRQAQPPTSVPSRCAAVSAELRADVDGDGCPERLRLAGGVLEAGSTRWAIDGSADDVVTGDWDCDGRATLAFLDRETGGVYRFATWSHERIVTVPLVAQVEGATELRVTHPGPPDCDVLTVDRADGPSAVLE